jgi:hypothetical protein
LTKASGVGSGDAAARATLLAGEPEVVTVLADAACGSGELHAELAVRGHVDRVKPAPIRPAVLGAFAVDAFLVDHTNRLLTCPAGMARHFTANDNAVFRVTCSVGHCRCAAPLPSTASP